MLEQEKKTNFGITNFRNQNIQFGIKIDDRRRHMYVIGKTGVGKTTLLENMVISDILAGHGIGVVDPHGEFAERLLDFIPEERLKDVIYFDPSDMAHPIAFNPLEQVSTEFRHLVASGIMGVFKKIWADLWSARMEYILNNALLALLEYPGSTLLGIMRMFSDKDYRKKVVDNLKDPVVKGFWVNEYAKYSQKFETEATAAIQNKVGQLVTNPLIRNILGQSHSSIDMRKAMDERKILIFNLSKGKIGEDNSALLGAMVITKLQLAAMSRVDIPESERKDFYLYVDEFQNFATDSFASILSEARKYRLCLILAHQYIRQLVRDTNTKVRDAIFGNVGTLLSFRVGAEDAEFLEREFQPDFMAIDFVNLPKYNFYTKLMIDGIASRPFSAMTIPPHPTPEKNFKELIIQNTRKNYGTPREVIEGKIAEDWLERSKQSAPEGAGSDRPGRRQEQPMSRMLRPSYNRGAEQRFQRPPRKDEGQPRTERPPKKHERPLADVLKPVQEKEPSRPPRAPAPPPIAPKPERPDRRPEQKADLSELRAALEKSLSKQSDQDDLDEIAPE